MIKEQLKEAKKACRSMQNIKPEIKNKALRSISEALICLLYTSPSPRDTR